MFEYHQPNIDSMQQYLSKENEKSSGEGPNWWSIPAGMSVVRILPPWDPTGRVALPVFMHPIEYKGEGMSYTKYNWTCVNKTFSKQCPICEGLANLAAAGVDISNWEATRRQFYFNAIVMHDPTYDASKNKGTAPGTHVLMKAPKTFYDWIIAQITNPMVGDITSITNGIDIYITKEGQGLGTSYNMTFSPNGRTAVPQEYLEKITNLYNLDDIFSVGFEQKQVDDLVNHLKKSAGVMNNSIPAMQQQMAGYTQAPMNTTGYPPMNNPVANPMTPSYGMPSMNTGVPVAANPYMNQNANASQDTPPWTQSQPTGVLVPPVAPVPTAPQSQADSNLPKCYGQYDSGSVNCVVCPHEISCSQSK